VAQQASGAIGRKAFQLTPYRRATPALRMIAGVSRSGYYDWRGRLPSARTTANLSLLADVRRLQTRHQGRYGSPRMHAALRAEGHRCTGHGDVEDPDH